ncbi:hypothetical protein ABK040_005576 [Willaertia magna]
MASGSNNTGLLINRDKSLSRDELGISSFKYTEEYNNEYQKEDTDRPMDETLFTSTTDNTNNNINIELGDKEERGIRFFSKDKSKAWAEKFFILFGPVWMTYFGIIIYYEVYDTASKLGWTLYGLPLALPCFLYPLLFPGEYDKTIPITQRYWFKANIWIGIYNFVGNYLLTHYFYKLLGASYTMNTYRINDVPYLMFLCTQAFFVLYFSVSNVLLRVVYSIWRKDTTKRKIGVCIFVFILSYITAFLETFGIQHFKYYVFKNRNLMYLVGSVVYSLHFIVSFPMYYRMDRDDKAKKYSIKKACLESLAACMLVTLLLDFWRLFIGSIVDVTSTTSSSTTIPWM